MAYKFDSTTKHLGPVAQDFHAAFGLGTDDKHIATVDADGVALAAIQGLNQKVMEELKRRDAENAVLKENRNPNGMARLSGFVLRHSFVIRHPLAKLRSSLLVIACCAALFQLPRSAKAQSYSVDWYTVDGGAAPAATAVTRSTARLANPMPGR